MMISDMSALPAVEAYLRRIGAEARSMRVAHVREQEGRYLREIAVVRLSKDEGQIAVSSPLDEDVSVYLPTDEERYAIGLEAKAAHWPELKPCSTIRNPPPMSQNAKSEDIFEFRDNDGNIIMLQLLKKKGTDKSYIPFTYWTDNQWRMIEPEGALPIWGIDQLKDHETAFIHEGAKAARLVRWMVEAKTPDAKAALAAHPWGEELRHAAHLGWIGGALSPHRTDWKVLHKLGVKRVYIVADNDAPGHAAVPKIARELRPYPIAVNSVRFDDRFPLCFDLADSMPERLFRDLKAGSDEGEHVPMSGDEAPRRYTGPALRDLIEPATWATRAMGSPAKTGKGRPPAPTFALRQEFADQWYMVAGEAKTTFVPRHDPSRRYTEEAFNALAQPFSDHRRPSDLFKQHGFGSIVHDLTYAPGDAAGVISINGLRSVNMYRPSRVRSLGRPLQPDEAKPWTDFLSHLIPSADERGHSMRWIATLIARPSVRMRYGLLLASTAQGVGKTTFCDSLGELVGRHNTSNPTAQQIIDSSFNSWIAAKRLVFVNEIYEGKGWTAYNKLKTYVTDDHIRVNEKFLPEYSVPNWAHFILCSNSDLALRVEDQDRRFFVPTVTEQRLPASFWTAFHAWLAGDGRSIIARWAEDFVREHGAVGPGDHAPMTARKRQMIEDSRSPNEQMVRDLALAALDQSSDTGQPIVLVDSDVAAWLPHSPGKEVPLHLIRGWLRSGGMHTGEERYKVDGIKRQVASTADISGKGWAALREYRTMPNDIVKDAL
jgi:hypothetical protein